MTFLETTQNDEALRAWMKGRIMETLGMKVVVSHTDREGATVPAGDLVNRQATLPDGRRVRVCHVSAQSREQDRTVFVMAEAPLDPVIK